MTWFWARAGDTCVAIDNQQFKIAPDGFFEVPDHLAATVAATLPEYEAIDRETLASRIASLLGVIGHDGIELYRALDLRWPGQNLASFPDGREAWRRLLRLVDEDQRFTMLYRPCELGAGDWQRLTAMELELLSDQVPEFGRGSTMVEYGGRRHLIRLGRSASAGEPASARRNRVEPSGESSATAPRSSSGVAGQRGTPGPKPALRLATEKRLRAAIADGTYTIETLGDAKGEALAAEFGVSRETVTIARKKVLSELSELGTPTNSDTE